MSSLYNRAEIYDLLESEKRNEAARRDWQGFLGGRSMRTLLDVSIGTGGMTLPLQELGIAVCGSDLSEAMLKRCGEKAMKKQKPVELKRCDFRDLSAWQDRQFDCVTSTGNSLGYVSNEDVRKVLEQMVGAARSARQNIVEGSSRAGTSKETELRLYDVARGSLEELAGDYEAFLIDAGFAPWSERDPLTANSRLDELGLSAEVLCRQFAAMAELVPNALGTVLAQARLQDVPDVDETAEKMQVEIAANCARSLL